MSRVAIFFLLVVCQYLAMLLALLGVATIPANPTGWFLFLVGVSYIAGIGIVYSNRKAHFWDADQKGAVVREERGDRSFWLISLGMAAAFFLPPLETIFLDALLPHSPWFAAAGLSLVLFGTALFAWARRTLRKNYSGHLSVNAQQTLVQCGPYRFVRHPAYAGFLCMALGISLGYASLSGLISVVVLLLPGLAVRMHVEDKMLAEHFGETYRRYTATVKKLIPGVW